MTFLKKLLLFLVLISLSATGIMYILEPLDSLEEHLFVYNNNLVCQKEIKSIILSSFESNQAFIKYNPLEFSAKIKKHPLIRDAVIRTNLLSNKKFSILVTEEKPWALFRNKIFNEGFQIIKDFDLEEDQRDFDSVYDLYNSILSHESQVIQIKNNNDLDIQDLQKLKKIIDKVNGRLDIITQAQVIQVDILDGEITLETADLKLIWGLSKNKVGNTIKKLDHLLSKIEENISKIEYIDLSLDTDEAIIGKRL